MKSKLIAYLLWFFLGTFGIHRLYCGRVLSGLIMAFLTIMSIMTLGMSLTWVIVCFWWFIDMFLIPGMVNSYNMHNFGANGQGNSGVIINIMGKGNSVNVSQTSVQQSVDTKSESIYNTPYTKPENNWK